MAAPNPVDNLLMDYLESQKSQPPPIMTKPSGKPIGNKDATLTVGRAGPALLQDHHMIDELAHFDRERIPERVVHAKGAGCFGYFEVTHDITRYCAAKVFQNIGKRTPVAARFSTGSDSKGAADTVRDFRGMGVKFYTEEGIWDLLNLQLPILHMRDPALFVSFNHSDKRNPVTDLKDPIMSWDYISQRPESIHATMMLFADRGIPDGFRYMHVYAAHAFKMVNKNEHAVYCKFHLRTAQGVRNLTQQQADQARIADFDYAARDLYNAILRGDHPAWDLFIQVMTFDQAERFIYNPFDLTKVWPQAEFPLIPVGRLVLNKIPSNFFADVEQIAFNPANLIPGIEPSQHDKMLDARFFIYQDTQRHRLGTNHIQLPINCPFKVRVANFERDGPQTFNNQNGAPNYFPNSFGGPIESLRAKHLVPPHRISGDVCRFNDNEDNFSQPREFWRRVLGPPERQRLVANIVTTLRLTYPFIQERMVNLFNQVDPEFGAMVSAALRLNATSNTQGNIPQSHPDWKNLDYLKIK